MFPGRAFSQLSVRFWLLIPVLLLWASAAHAQSKPDLTVKQTYTAHRATSKETTDGGLDSLTVNPGETRTILDVAGPGEITHLWFTLNDPEPYHLKRIVLRMYWDGEQNPSVESPIGDFFGLGLGSYHSWQSDVLSVGSSRALNSFFTMPFATHARITVTNQGKQPLNSLYYNLDYQTTPHALPAGTLYFHAQYRQAQPNHGWTNLWYSNYDPLVVLHATPVALPITSGCRLKEAASSSA